MITPIMNIRANNLDGESSLVSETRENPYLRVIQLSEDGVLLELTPVTPSFENQLLDGELCETVTIPELPQLESPGMPPMPVQGAMLGIPQGAQPTIQILSAEPTSLSGNHWLCPSPQLVLNPTSEGPWQLSGYVYERGSNYQLDTFLPSAPVELITTGNLRSQHFAEIRFNPLQYNAVNRELRFFERILVEVRFNAPVTQITALDGASISEGYFEDSLQNVLLNYEQARPWRSQPISKLRTYTAVEPPNQTSVKILVNQDGIYQVDYTDLSAAGVPVDSLDPDKLQLFNQSTEVAINVELGGDGIFNDGDYLLFYGQKVDTKYTETNVYWLIWDNSTGLRMVNLDGTPSGSASVPTEFLTTVHAELSNLDNNGNPNYYPSKSSGPENDHWYWDRIVASSAPAYKEFTTILENLSTSSHSIEVRGLLKGYSANPNHHTRIYLNDNLIDDHSFPSGSEYAFANSVLQTDLVEGINKLKIECPRDGAITSDIVLFNWFEIDYYDTYFAENDRLFFDGDQPGTWEFQVDGFSSSIIEVYDITEPLFPTNITGAVSQATPNGQQLAFDATISGEHHYVAQTTDQRLSPISISMDSPSNWKTDTIGADYIIISHASFLTQVQPLANFRTSQGYRVQVIDVQDLYDEFNGGVFSPEAIKSFLEYAYFNWTLPAPSFVLLVGDGNFDFKNVTGWNEPNYIPPYLADVDPYVGEVPTDNQYVSINGGDILPDMYIGRFPARTTSEAQTMVNKTINYEQNPPQDGWNAFQTFVADDADGAGNFPFLSDLIINTYVPSTYSVDKIYYGINYFNSSTSRAALRAAINQGRLIVHYSGHANTQFWASPYMFHLSDLPSLTNGSKLPFILPMTCGDGYFIWPKPPNTDYSALGESVVRLNGGGAIASWSPTGYGLTEGHDILDHSLFNNLFNFNQTQLGYLTTQAKYELFAQTAGFNDLIETYLLFGDPALKLQILPVPEAPSNLIATAISQTQINLSWSDNSDDETGFQIERSLDNSTWNQIALVGANITDYNNTDLTASTLYYYRVRSTNSYGDSSYSNTASDTTFAQPAPEAPSNLIATAISHTQIDLAWNDNSGDETEFQIERSPDGLNDWQLISVVGADVTSYNDTGLSCGTPFFYRVRAYRAGVGQVSDYSNTATATTSECYKIFLPLVEAIAPNPG